MQDIAPRDTGEILSDAAVLLRRNVGAAFLLALPQVAASVILLEAAQSLAAPSLKALQTGSFAVRPGQLTVAALAWLASTSAGLWAYASISAMFYDVIIHGGAAVTRHRARVGLARTPAALGIFFATYGGIALLGFLPPLVIAGAIAAGFAMAHMPTAAAVVAGLGVLVFLARSVELFVRWALASQAVVIEHLGPIAALRRSTMLMRSKGMPFMQKSGVRASILLLIYLVMTFSLQGMTVAPRALLASLAGAPGELTPPLFSFPVWFIVPMAALQVATGGLLVPFCAVLFTRFYVDVRARTEGLGLQDDDAAAARA